jgi:hypothetical protein
MSTEQVDKSNQTKAKKIVAATNKTKKTKRKQQQRNRTVKKNVAIEADSFVRTRRLLEEVYGLNEIDIISQKTPSQFLNEMIDANPDVDTHSVVDLGVLQFSVLFALLFLTIRQRYSPIA